MSFQTSTAATHILILIVIQRAMVGGRIGVRALTPPSSDSDSQLTQQSRYTAHTHHRSSPPAEPGEKSRALHTHTHTHTHTYTGTLYANEGGAAKSVPTQTHRAS